MRCSISLVNVSAEQLLIGDGCRASLVGSQWACGVR
jgi:hypothetical protein